MTPLTEADAFWAECEPIFRESVDGGGPLVDVVVRGTSAQDWQLVVDRVVASYPARFTDDTGTDVPPPGMNALFARRAEAGMTMQIAAGPLHLNSYFFTDAELDFDADARELDSPLAFQCLLDFGRLVGKATGKPVHLALEGGHDRPFLEHKAGEWTVWNERDPTNARWRLLVQLVEEPSRTARVAKDLAQFGWDSETEMVTFSKDHLGAQLHNFLNGLRTAAELEEWANAIEGRDDIGFMPAQGPLVKAVLHDLANPVLQGPLTRESAERMLARLRAVVRKPPPGR